MLRAEEGGNTSLQTSHSPLLSPKPLKVFVEEGCEVAAVNENGIGAADILR